MSKFGRAIAGEGGKFLRENKEHHQDIVQRVSKLFLDAIKVVLEGHSVLKDSLERVRKMNSLLIESSKNYTSWATVDGCIISNIRFENNISEPVKPWKRGMTSDRDENNNSPGNITFSSHIPSSTRNGDKEATGLPPNFVHSIDACHMRLFIDKMSKNTNNFWSYMMHLASTLTLVMSLMKMGTETFFDAHNCEGWGSFLHKLVDDSLDLYDKKMEEITNLRSESKSNNKSSKADELEKQTILPLNDERAKLSETIDAPNKDLVNASDRVDYDLAFEKLTKFTQSEVNMGKSAGSIGVDFDKIYLLS